MSGRGPRTYGRKKGAAPPMSQFDRLISEASNKSSHHPVAAKTAGHVGKWGMTSFTSLRSINGSLGKEETLKRGNSSEECDPFGFESEAKSEGKLSCPTVKRRKFFKSRDVGVGSTIPNESSSNVTSVADANNKDVSKVSMDDSVTVKGSCSKEISSKPTGSGGGIKLKIFKSRNAGTDVYSPEVYSSTIQLPTDESSNSSLSSNGTLDSMPSNGNAYNNTTKKVSNNDSQSFISSSIDSKLELENFSELKSNNVVAPADSVKNDSGLISETLTPQDSPFEESPKSFSDNNRNEEPVSSVVGVDLFSTDFDENEIVDRTSIDYLSSEPLSFTNTVTEPESSLSRESGINVSQTSTASKDPVRPSSQSPGLFDDLPVPLSRSKTLDLGETEASGSSSSTACSIPKSLSEIDPSSYSKKKSIFKSRQKDGETKKRATYTHKWHGHEEKEKKENVPLSFTQADDPFGFDGSLTKVPTKSTSSSGFAFDEEESFNTSVKCPKQAKKYYTVIKNVKKTHQLQESGEFQEFNDDVDYFLDALRCSNKVATRCLASLNLAQKSMVPAFRMHLRAHATVTKFFRALLDAPNHPHLAQCAAMVMFALSQDRLNMDLDKGSLELMLNLLDTDATSMDDIASSFDGAEHIDKIKSLCKELQIQGHAKHLKLNQINAANLAMETLLSLTSKRAGEWFKEELRQLGGIDHLVRTVTSNTTSITADMQSWTSSHIDKLSRIDRCLKVLENVTHQNAANQEYLLHMENGGEFSKNLMRLFWICHQQIMLNPQTGPSNSDLPVSKNLVATLITTLKVLINLTHGAKKEALGSKVLGCDEEIYTLTLSCLLRMPQYLTHDSKFEIQVLSCCLLLNLVEKSETNRERLMRIDSPVDQPSLDDTSLFEAPSEKRVTSMCSLVTLFYSSEESAREQEAHTDNIIDKDLVQSSKEEEKKDEDIEETVARLLQKAGRHMEDTLIAAYTALLAGYCLLDNKEFEVEIRSMQPEGHFKTMVTVLKKFLHFMNLTATTSLLRSLKPTEQVVTYMENLDKDPAKEKKKVEEEEHDSSFDDAFGF